MNASIKAKSLLATAFEITGVNAGMLRKLSKGAVAVLMYHRVLPREHISKSVQAGMFVEPNTLALHVRYLKQHFDLVSMSNFAADPESFFRRSLVRPICILTFDDGWYDFYQYAYPILLSEEVPATVFVPTNFIGTDRWFWTDRLGHLLLDDSFSNGLGEAVAQLNEPLLDEILKFNGSIERRLEQAIHLLKTQRIQTIDNLLVKVSSALSPASVKPGSRAFLNWDEVREMFDSGLIAFGSHTASHPILTTLSEPELVVELKESMNTLLAKQVADARTMAFCYPNGGTSGRIQELVREAGYKVAVTTERGWVRGESNSYAMPRIPIHQDMTSKQPMLASRMAMLL